MEKSIYVLSEWQGTDFFWGESSMIYVDGPFTEEEATKLAEKRARKGYKATLMKPFAKFELEKPSVKITKTDL